MDFSRREIFKTAIGALCATFAAGCSRDVRRYEELETLMAGKIEVTPEMLAAEARIELAAIVVDVNVSNGICKYMLAENHEEMNNFSPFYVMSDRINPTDVLPGMMVIDAKNPEYEHLKLIGEDVEEIFNIFSRMETERVNPGAAGNIFTREELGSVSEETIFRATSLLERFPIMMEKALGAGIVRFKEEEPASVPPNLNFI